MRASFLASLVRRLIALLACRPPAEQTAKVPSNKGKEKMDMDDEEEQNGAHEEDDGYDPMDQEEANGHGDEMAQSFEEGEEDEADVNEERYTQRGRLGPEHA